MGERQIDRLAAKEKVRSGSLGDVTLVTSRAFMNRLVAIDNYRRTDKPETISAIAEFKQKIRAGVNA